MGYKTRQSVFAILVLEPRALQMLENTLPLRYIPSPSSFSFSSLRQGLAKLPKQTEREILSQPPKQLRLDACMGFTYVLKGVKKRP